MGLPILGPIALDTAGAAAGAGLDAAGELLGRSDLVDIENRSGSAEGFDLLSLLTQLGLQGAELGLPILGPIALDAAGAAAGAGLNDVEDRSKSASAEDFDLLSLINLLNTLVNTFGALTGSTGTIPGTTGTGTAI